MCEHCVLLGWPTRHTHLAPTCVDTPIAGDTTTRVGHVHQHSRGLLEQSPGEPSRELPNGSLERGTLGGRGLYSSLSSTDQQNAAHCSSRRPAQCCRPNEGGDGGSGVIIHPGHGGSGRPHSVALVRHLHHRQTAWVLGVADHEPIGCFNPPSTASVLGVADHEPIGCFNPPSALAHAAS